MCLDRDTSCAHGLPKTERKDKCLCGLCECVWMGMGGGGLMGMSGCLCACMQAANMYKLFKEIMKKIVTFIKIRSDEI